MQLSQLVNWGCGYFFLKRSYWLYCMCVVVGLLICVYTMCVQDPQSTGERTGFPWNCCYEQW